MGAAITVVGSINLDFVATARTLPAPGETVTGAMLARHPGGKNVAMVGRVGQDALAEEALTLLKAEGVDLSGCLIDDAASTGVALIAVDAKGENQIVVAPGANAAFQPSQLAAPIEGALICQLEIPVETVARAVALTAGFVCLNLAPAADVPAELLARADLIVVNETEAAFYGARLHDGGGLVAITLGARGAALFKAGEQIAVAIPPKVTAIDATGAGDSFVGALVVALIEGQEPKAALIFACAAGASAATRAGAQPSLPRRVDVAALL
jgi:ribokinase